MKAWLWRKREDLSWWVARKLPARLQYCAFNLVLGHATTGKYGDEEAPAITWQTASQRFARDHKL